MTEMTRLHPGDRFPALSVALSGGRGLRLPGDLAGRVGVVLFYRGGWCPYCNAQLSAFQRSLEVLASLDVSVVALSVDDQAATADLIARHGAVRFPPAAVVTSGGPADGTGSARRLRTLIAIGHSEARLASLLRHCGAPESGRDIAGLVTPPIGAKVTVSSGTHDAICRLYDDLRDQPPPEHSPGERTAAAAARAQSRQHDWPTPAALDDDLIDDPAYQPEAGWLPATLAGAPQHRFIAPPAPIIRLSRPARRAGPARVASHQHRRTAGTKRSRQEAADGTATA